jgi:hypothetical protein
MEQPNNIVQQPLTRFQARSTSISDYSDGLRELGYRVSSFEDLGITNNSEPSQPVVLKNATLQQILDEIVRQNPSYCWEQVNNNLINIFPENSILDSKVPYLDVKNKGLWRVLEEDLEIEKKGIYLFVEFGESDGELIDLSLESADLREALNAIINQLDRTIWHISGRQGAYYLTISNLPDNGEL